MSARAFLTSLGLVILSAGFLAAQELDLGTEAQREAGREIYEKKCSQCHGEDGDGNGVAAPFFKPAPRDFTTAAFKIRTTESGELPTDDDLKKIVREGMPYTGMPPWPDLSEEEVANIVYYMKTFVEDFADPDWISPPLEIPKAPPLSEASVKRGRTVYEENKCADCHGNLGRGDGVSAPTLKDDWDRRIKAADLTKKWTFRGGSSRTDIYRTFTTGLNGTPMPSYLDLMEEEDRWHLVEYVFSLSEEGPDYATIVTAVAVGGEIDLSQGKSLFENAPVAVFPILGQVIEPGRSFYPDASAIEVSAVFSGEEIAIMLSWHDMSADRSGSNSPSAEAPIFDPGSVEAYSEAFSDAVAIQVPSKDVHGFVRPYFLFGDRRNPVDIWFADLAKDSGELFVGKGSRNIESGGEDVPVASSYEDGRWEVMFKRKRFSEDGLSFKEGDFVPVAFSLWDGFSNDRGNKRGVTSWYHLYLKPAKTTSKTVPVATSFLGVLLIEIVVISVVKRRHRSKAVTRDRMPTSNAKG